MRSGDHNRGWLVKASAIAAGLGLFLIGCSAPGRAAEITIIKSGQAGTLVSVSGDLELADGERFANLVRPLGPTIVILNSRGGSLLAGLRIGQIASSRKFATVVPNDSICASACALAWLGGAARYLGPRGRLGFHAAYMGDSGAEQVSGSGNALVGAYLERLGLSEEAIYALTDAAPNSMRWIDVATANSLGIATKEVGTTAALPPAQIETASGTPRQRSVALANAYFSAGSGDATSALAWMAARYGGPIDFYGKMTSRDDVLTQKAAFVRRWPERIYVPVDRSVAVSCAADQKVCRVTGTVQFECRSYMRGASSAGLASFALTFDLHGRLPLVIEESGRVLYRH